MASALSGCASRASRTAPPAATALFGVYRARIDTDTGESRRFRLLLYAALPDRLHAEALSPVGTTELIVDSGGGRVAITFPRDGVTYHGGATPQAMERLLGVPVEVERLIHGLLVGSGDPATAPRMVRHPLDVPGLPERFEIQGTAAHVRLRRKGLDPVRADVSRLGTGEPPVGTDVRPLEELW